MPTVPSPTRSRQKRGRGLDHQFQRRLRSPAPRLAGHLHHRGIVVRECTISCRRILAGENQLCIAGYGGSRGRCRQLGLLYLLADLRDSRRVSRRPGHVQRLKAQTDPPLNHQLNHRIPACSRILRKATLPERNGYRFDAGKPEHKITDRCPGYCILNSPRTRPGIARSGGLIVLWDEVCSATRYGHTHASVPDINGMAERTILLDSSRSKIFAMPGWSRSRPSGHSSAEPPG